MRAAQSASRNATDKNVTAATMHATYTDTHRLSTTVNRECFNRPLCLPIQSIQRFFSLARAVVGLRFHEAGTRRQYDVYAWEKSAAATQVC